MIAALRQDFEFLRLTYRNSSLYCLHFVSLSLKPNKHDIRAFCHNSRINGCRPSLYFGMQQNDSMNEIAFSASFSSK